MAETILKQLSDVTKKFKSSVYAIVNNYKKLIHTINSDPNIVTKMCKISIGQISEDGKIFVTKDMFNKFVEDAINICSLEALYWTKYLESIDTFFALMLDWRQPQNILSVIHDKQMLILFQVWFGDMYDVKHIQGLERFIKHIEAESKTLNTRMFRYLTTKPPEKDDSIFLPTDPILSSE